MGQEKCRGSGRDRIIAPSRHREEETMRKTAISGLLCLVLLGCQPARPTGITDDLPDFSVRSPAPDAAVAQPDLAYACGQYSNYQAAVNGIVRSPCREAPIVGNSCATPCTIDANVVIKRTSIIIG